MPKVWAQICIQRVVQLSKESTTMRRVLDPMFIYFDTRQQWVPSGLAFIVLSDMAYFMDTPGNFVSICSLSSHILFICYFANLESTCSGVPLSFSVGEHQIATIYIYSKVGLKVCGVAT